MKKLLAVFALFFILNGCDDGDVKVDTINFDDITAAKCPDNQIIYKINDNQVLLLELTEYPFDNNPGVKQPIEISTTNQVRYRLYSSTVSAANICSNIQPATPVVTEEWIATAGTVEITTTQVLSNPDAITGATTISKYNHNIVFKNIIFAKPNGSQVYETFTFGDYTTSTTTLPFDFNPDEVMMCPATNVVYNARQFDREALFIQNFDPALFSTDAGSLNIAKTMAVGETSNKLIYRLLKTQFPAGTLEDYFCEGGTSPETDQEWTGISGDIEVTTVVEGSGFRHTIRLKNVTFQKGNSSFFYGYDILYGQLITN